MLDAWNCPDECPDFLAELERRINDIKIQGNFTRMQVTDGVMYRQRYQNHQPIGEPEPVRAWPVRAWPVRAWDQEED